DRELGRWLFPHDFVKATLLVSSSRAAQGGFILKHSPAALLPALVPLEMAGFARRKRDQQMPQIVPIGQLRKPTVGSPPTEASEGTEGHILLVGGAPRSILQSLARQAHQPLEIALPKLLRRGGIPGPKLPDPVSDRPFRCHAPHTPGRNRPSICHPHCKVGHVNPQVTGLSWSAVARHRC